MTILPQLIRHALASLRTRFRPLTPIHIDDLPDHPAGNVIYLVGDAQKPWLAALQCPCRCGALIQLSLLQRDKPRWRLDSEPGAPVSLYPSIWRVRGCRSHFYVRQGRVIWARGRIPGRNLLTEALG